MVQDKQTFIDSLPVLMGYVTMGLVAGILLAARGDVMLSPLWAFLSSSLWVTGTMSIASVPHIAARDSIWAFVLMTLAVNFRYCFYGFSMLSRWQGVSFWRKAYLILMLTDENYALECAKIVDEKHSYWRYCTVLSLLNHSYWVVGVTVGASIVFLLGRIINPDVIRHYSAGMEFSMAALFLVIFTDQLRNFIGAPRAAKGNAA